jgi:enterochelin esterase family protein
VVVTCGAIEENVQNNRLLTATLARLGYDVRKAEVADVHNYTAWRDAFHPHLGTLIRKVVAT